MKIISHRGFWKSPVEKNTLIAFEKSINNSYGFEFDIRDQNGELVISHDVPITNCLKLNEVLSLVSKEKDFEKLPLALNIKSDGLALKLKNILDKFKGIDAFVFDMSIPDMKAFIDCEIPFFTRISDIEKIPIWIDKASGIWVDAFYKDWLNDDEIKQLLNYDKNLCIVSPELHKRDYAKFWELLINYKDYDKIILCTDFPDKASEYFKI